MVMIIMNTYHLRTSTLMVIATKSNAYSAV